ncbi:hypothetical protein MPSEU_000289900 [Mayamaea pseudoterrestris]|nr:hypothetical protein MPSEU_000289900 [Mayamaea pseudoterrestris]
MPHHSAQQQSLVTTGATISPSVQKQTRPFVSAMSFPSPQNASGLQLHPSRQGQMGLLQHSPMSPHHTTVQLHHQQHHLVPDSSSSWPGTTNHSKTMMVHRVDSHGSHEMASMNGQNRPMTQHLTPTRRLSTASSSSKSFDSPHGVAASVLLLAASKIREQEEEETSSFTNNAKTATDNDAPTAPSSSTGPLKKRKGAVADVMRPKLQQQQHQSPEETSSHAHVSPMSHGTHQGAVSTSTTPNSMTSHSPRHQSDSIHSNATPSASSYELHNGQALLDSSKIRDTKEIGTRLPFSHVELAHFPSILHAVLQESEFRDSVLQWLPHGQAWRVVRWDAMRKLVLPKYFTALCDEQNGSSGSIDAFLWHLQAWGFDEVTDGPDAGAYTSVLFRRELPQLCREMRFCPPPEKHQQLRHDKDETRSILQVPSLTSSGVDRASACEEKKEDDHHHANVAPPPRTMMPPVWRSNSMAYRPSNPMLPQQRHDNAWSVYTPEPPHWMNHIDATNRAVPPYSPLPVRSSRGAARMALSMPAMHQRHYHHAQHSPLQHQSPHHEPRVVGFPVSNRGRGGPAAAARRIITTPLKSVSTEHVPSSSILPVEQPKRSSILKRKLPMASSRQSSGETMSETDDDGSCASSMDQSVSKRSKVETMVDEGAVGQH